MNPIVKALRKAALEHADVEEGIACAGTVLESRTVKVNGKAFVFLGPKNLRLKLAGSLDEARKLAAKDPDRFSAGAGGWVAVTYADDLPLRVLTKWVAESYAVMSGAAKPVTKNVTKKKAAKKKTAR